MPVRRLDQKVLDILAVQPAVFPVVRILGLRPDPHPDRLHDSHIVRDDVAPEIAGDLILDLGHGQAVHGGLRFVDVDIQGIAGWQRAWIHR